MDPFKEETCDDYDLFVRFCRTSDNKLLAEGFCPHDNLGNGGMMIMVVILVVMIMIRSLSKLETWITLDGHSLVKLLVP